MGINQTNSTWSIFLICLTILIIKSVPHKIIRISRMSSLVRSNEQCWIGVLEMNSDIWVFVYLHMCIGFRAQLSCTSTLFLAIYLTYLYLYLYLVLGAMTSGNMTFGRLDELPPHCKVSWGHKNCVNVLLCYHASQPIRAPVLS